MILLNPHGGMQGGLVDSAYHGGAWYSRFLYFRCLKVEEIKSSSHSKWGLDGEDGKSETRKEEQTKYKPLFSNCIKKSSHASIKNSQGNARTVSVGFSNRNIPYMVLKKHSWQT